MIRLKRGLIYLLEWIVDIRGILVKCHCATEHKINLSPLYENLKLVVKKEYLGNVMSQITEETFEHAFNQFLSAPAIDLRDAAFIDPYGMVGILEIGELLKSKGIRKTIQLPRSEEVLKYLERIDFFRFADDYFDLEFSNPLSPPKYLRSSYSDVLLEITPIESSDDIHFIVGKVKDRAKSILTKHLHYD